MAHRRIGSFLIRGGGWMSSDEERDVLMLTLMQRGEDELFVATQALGEARTHLCASRAYRAMHAMVAAVLATRDLAYPEDEGALAAFDAVFVAAGHFPATFMNALRQAHRLQQMADGQPGTEVAADKVQATLKNANTFCYALKDALTKWKQGRALQ
jgi:uncharacterized protein (UPF0332 family)